MKTCTFVLVSVLAVGVYAQENSSPCTICPNVVASALDHVPFAAYGDHTTCAEFIERATTVEAGTEECGFFEFNEAYCCNFNEPVNPCNVCPNGVTVGRDPMPASSANRCDMTCTQIIYEAQNFETVSFVCGLMRGAESECCPSVPVANPAPEMTPTAPMVNESSGGSNGNVLVTAISAVAVISFMALAIFYIRKMASNVKEQMQEGVIPTAVAMTMDPETAGAPAQAPAPFSKLNNPYAPPPYAPHASAPPLE